MPSLRQLLADQTPLLLLDAASARIQAAVFTGNEVRWATSEAEADRGIFACLEELQVAPGAMRAFAFCEGPGSILGVRTTAMIVRTWQVVERRPVYGYLSLAMVAAAQADPATWVIADARRERWHCLRAGASLERRQADQLSDPRVMPEGFRVWSELPAGTRTVPYRLFQLLDRPEVSAADLFRLTDAPDAFLHEEPTYATWSPQIHRAPARP